MQPGHPFRSSSTRPKASVFLTLLLLSSYDVQSNLGPASVYMFGSINVRLGFQQLAVLHDIINDCQLDLIALPARNMDYLGLAMKLNITPDEYSILHVHRESAMSTGKSWGGSLAVIFCNLVVIHQNSLQSAVTLTSFEFQLIRVDSKHSFSILINIYHPLSSSLMTFYDELSELITIVGSGTTDCIVLCGERTALEWMACTPTKNSRSFLTRSTSHSKSTHPHEVTRC